MQVKIGNAKYQGMDKAEYHCSCVRYVSADNTELIVGLSVGLVLLLIIIIIIIIIIIVLKCRRQHSKPIGRGVSGDNGQTSMDLASEDRNYNRQLPDEYSAPTVGSSDEGGHIIVGDQPSIFPEDRQYDRQLPDDGIKDEQL